MSRLNNPQHHDPNASLTLDEMLEKYENGEATYSEMLELFRSITRNEMEALHLEIAFENYAKSK